GCRGNSGVGVLRDRAGSATGAILLRQKRRNLGCRGRTAMQALNISLVQGNTRWHDPAGNRGYYGDLMAPLRGHTDLIVLPETFTSGFSNEAIAQAETMEGATLAWLREQAGELDAAITGSVQLRAGDDVFNRLLFVTPDGAVRHYDKRHLFRYADEHKRYAPGRERLLV